MNDGYIKLYRRMMKWGWYKDSKTKDVFLHLLFLACYEPCFFKGEEIHEGQCVTTVHEISAGTGISVSSVKTALNHLKSTNELTIKTTSKFSIITLNNYAEYQGDSKDFDKRLTNDRQTDSKRIANLSDIKKEKKDKKDKKDKNIYISGVKKKENEPSFDINEVNKQLSENAFF